MKTTPSCLLNDLVKEKNLIVIYRMKGATCSSMRLHRVLHGRREVRTSTNEFGRVIHKTFEYPGILHRDLIPGVIAAGENEAARIQEKFREFNVSHLLIQPKEISQFGKWDNQKSP